MPVYFILSVVLWPMMGVGRGGIAEFWSPLVAALKGGTADDECRVTKFEMDGYDDTAVASLCNAVRFCFLCGLRDLMDWGREKVHLVFLLH